MKSFLSSKNLSYRFYGNLALCVRLSTSLGWSQEIDVLPGTTQYIPGDYPSGDFNGGNIKGTLVNSGTLNNRNLLYNGHILNIGNGITDGTTLTGNIINNDKEGNKFGQIFFHLPPDAPGKTLFTYSDIISGIGDIIQDGPGTVILSGANTYTGFTLVRAGTLQMGRVDALSSSESVGIYKGATFHLNNYNQSIGRLQGEEDASIILGTAHLTIHTNNLPSTYEGNITGENGSHFTKIGPGTFAITGNIDVPTTVSEGKLAGTGSVASIINNGGTLSPGIGNQYGKLTLNGNYTGSGTLEISLSPVANPVGSTHYSVLDVGPNTFDATNTKLSFNVAPGTYTANTTYNFIETRGAGQVIGHFQNDGMISNIGAFRPKINYNNGAGALMTLTLRRIILEDNVPEGASSTTHILTNYMDNLPMPPVGSPTATLIGTLDTLYNNDYTKAVESLSPEDEADWSSMINSDNSFLYNGITGSRLDVLRDTQRHTGAQASFVPGISQTSFTKMKAFTQNLHQPASLSSTGPSFNVTKAGVKQEMTDLMHHSALSANGEGGLWTHALGYFAKQKDLKNTVGFRSKTAALMIGADRRLSKTIFAGLSMGYSQTHLTVNHNEGINRLQSYFMSVYSTWYKEKFYLEVSAVGSLNCYSLARKIQIPTLSTYASSRHKGYELTPHVGIGYEMTLSSFMLEPFGNVDFAMSHEKGYKETGVIQQHIAARNSYLLRTEGGLNISRDIPFESYLLTPSLKVSYIYKKPINNGPVIATFSGAGSSYSLPTSKTPLHEFSLGTEARVRFKNNLFLSASYNGEFSRSFKAHEFTLKLGKRF